MLQITPAEPHELDIVRTLWQEYAATLGVSLCFQNFEAELAELPGRYAPPEGRLLLGRDQDEVVGAIAMRSLGDGIAEMKRLYVRPAYRGHGYGRLLAKRIIAEAHTAGYRAIRLDTLPMMAAAIVMYRALGFWEISPYYVNPVPGALFFELSL